MPVFAPFHDSDLFVVGIDVDNRLLGRLIDLIGIAGTSLLLWRLGDEMRLFDDDD